MKKIFDFLSGSKSNHIEELKKLQKLSPEDLESKLKEERSNLIKEYNLDDLKKPMARKPLKVGLENLGNTCFMNSILQCLVHNDILREHFLEAKFLGDLNVLSSASKGVIACEFYNFVIKYCSTTKQEIAPSNIKKTFAKYKSSFGGYHQQDSQEFLSYLLDMIHEDLNSVIFKPYESLDYKVGENINNFLKESFQMHLKRNKSFIVDTFHGQFYSKIICPEPECQTVSLNADPFDILTVNIPDTRNNKYDTFFFPASYDGQIEKFTFKCTMMMDTIEITNHLKQNTTTLKNKRYRLFYYEKLKIDHEIYDDHPSTSSNLIESKGYPIYCETLSAEISQLVFEDRAQDLFKTKWENAFKLKLMVHMNGEFNGIERMVEVPESITSLELELLCFMIHRKLFIEDKFYYEKAPSYPKTKNEVIEELAKFKEFCKEKKEPNFMKIEIKSGEDQVPLSFTNLFSHAHNKIVKVNVSFTFKDKDKKLKLRLINTVPIPDLSNQAKTVTLDQCLEIFSKKEILDENNKWYCSNCKQHLRASKELLISRAPEILIIHLKRFKYSSSEYNGTVLSKNRELINFPLDLNINKYMYFPTEQVDYSLFAVSQHYGNLGSGHYTAACKVEDEWYKFDDETFKKIHSESIVDESAYVLFYQRKRNGGNIRSKSPIKNG